MKYLVSVLFLIYSMGGYSVSSEDVKEIEMASEGAQKHITENASFLKFKDGNFVTIRKGSNNFTCFVVHDPNGRYEPSCLNQEAMRSVFPTYELHMRLLYSGNSYKETNNKIKAAFDNGEIPTAEAGSLVYMMSPRNKIFNPESGKLEATPAHHMYFYPKLNDETFSLKNGPPWLWQGFPNMSALIVVVTREEP